MKVFSHKEFLKVYTSDPAAAKGRIESVLSAVETYVQIVDIEPASESDIGLAHSKKQIEYVREEGLYDIAALAAGGAPYRLQTAE